MSLKHTLSWVFRMLTRHHPDHEPAGMNGDDAMPKPSGPSFNLACMCIGAPACGMNAAVRYDR